MSDQSVWGRASHGVLRSLVVVCILSSASAAAARGDSPAPNVTAKIEADWESANLNLTRVNPAVGSGQDASRQSLAVQGRIKIVDSGNVIAFDGGVLNVTRMLDENGTDISELAERPRGGRGGGGGAWYRPLEYGNDYDHATRTYVETLAPKQFAVALQLNEALPARIALLEGEQAVLTAERIETVDLPYKVSEAFTEIAPGLAVRFTEAKGDAANFSYALMDRSAVDGDRKAYEFRGRVDAESPLPARIVLAQFLVDPDGKPLDGQRRGHGFPSGAGSSSGSVGKGPIGALRFEVAVNPRAATIPVVVRNVELPSLQAARTLAPGDVAARDLAPVARMEAALARQLQKHRDRGDKVGWTDEKDGRVREQWRQFVASHEAGTASAYRPAAVKGTTPDAGAYDAYLGTYALANPRGGEAGELVVRKDERGRWFVDTPEGPSPAVTRDGAIFAVFDDVLIRPSDPLDPRSAPALAGFWVIRSGAETRLEMDTGRAQPAMVLQPKAQASATGPARATTAPGGE